MLIERLQFEAFSCTLCYDVYAIRYTIYAYVNLKLLLDNKKIISLSCGQSFTIALTEDGEVVIIDTQAPGALLYFS